jgi:hypothetical protein
MSKLRDVRAVIRVQRSQRHRQRQRAAEQDAKQGARIAGVMERPPGSTPGLERRVCKPPGVGATVNQFPKWKFRINAFLSSAQADSLTWQTLAPMPRARYGTATGAIGAKLYVAGGCCVANSFPYPRFTENEAYDPSHQHMDDGGTNSPRRLRRCDRRHQRKSLLISHGWPNRKGDTVKVSWLIALGLVVGLIVAASFGTALAQSDPVQHEFRICLGDFALCAASTCTPDGKKIAVNGTTTLFDEAQCTCPIFPGPSIADVVGGNMKGSCQPPRMKGYGRCTRQRRTSRRRLTIGRRMGRRRMPLASIVPPPSRTTFNSSTALASRVCVPVKSMACR